MLINRRELIAFFDERGEGRKHANAIKAVAGEELGLQLLVDFFRRKNQKAQIELPCTTGQLRGTRLDGWLQVTDRAFMTTCYQVEVKLWSAHSVGGRPLPFAASGSELAKFKEERWKRYWGGDRFNDLELNKVLTPMRSPFNGAKVYPLACLWDAVHPTGGLEPFFDVPLHDLPFEKVFVFSMSAFLRGLDESTVHLELPFASERLRLLKSIFPQTV